LYTIKLNLSLFFYLICSISENLYLPEILVGDEVKGQILVGFRVKFSDKEFMISTLWTPDSITLKTL